MAAPTLDQMASDDTAFMKQASDARNAKAQQDAQASGQEQPSLLQRWTTSVGRVTNSMIDSAVSAADDPNTWYGAASRVGRDAAAGVTTGATNIADAAYSFGRAAVQNMTEPGYKQTQRDLSGEAAPPTPPSSPIWDHAKGAILDFRDAVAVQDPNIVDRLTQGVAQLAVPFAGYSRMVAGVHGLASVVAAGALTDATALAPHDARMADLIALGRHTEGKLGDALRALAPDGGAVNAYINYLGDRGNESEAEGRFKNVIDGFGVNMIATPLLTAAATVLKQGTAGLRYLAENGAVSAGDIAGIRSPASQRGAVGDLSQPRPPLRQNYDPAGTLSEEQVRRDMEAAHAAEVTGRGRPPLRQGADPAADTLYEQQVREDVRGNRVLANNASGESAASQEAQNWVAANKNAGIVHYRLDPEGRPTILTGIEARDPRPITGHPVVQLSAQGEHEIIERGGLTKQAANGLVERSRQLHGLGKFAEKGE